MKTSLAPSVGFKFSKKLNASEDGARSNVGQTLSEWGEGERGLKHSGISGEVERLFEKVWLKFSSG